MERIAAHYPGQRCRSEIARIPRPVRALAESVNYVAPLLKEAVLLKSASRFQGFDALVVPESGSLRLKRRLPDLPIILTQHGAGDRAAGFDARIAQADFILVPGRKLERRYKEHGLIRDDNHAVVGYAKLDAVAKAAPDRKTFFC
ncbi:MAG: hypothetical protein RQ826_00100 [Xanthomonadales bacterium]|nr:hypothetical protein [Xanthomonadales bacterium]